MRYLVDIEKKEIVYHKDMPAGHMIALRKVFKDKGFKFHEKDDLKTVEELSIEMQETMRKPGNWGNPLRSSGGAPHTPTQSFRMDIMDMSDAAMKQAEMRKQAAMKKAEHEAYLKRKAAAQIQHWSDEQIHNERMRGGFIAPDGKHFHSQSDMKRYIDHKLYKGEITEAEFNQVMRPFDMDEWLDTSDEAIEKAKKNYHPADKSNVFLKHEASKIKEEIKDAQEASGLYNSLVRLQNKLAKKINLF